MNLPPDVSGVVLAGGSSRRMGRDKLSLKVGGETLLGRSCRLLGRFCREVIVVGEDGPKVPFRRVPDARGGKQGPLAGLEAGLRAAGSPIAFVSAGDLPFVSEGLARHLLERVAGGAPAALARWGGCDHPLYAAYDREVLGEVSAALDAGERSMSAFLARLRGVEYVRDDLARFGDPAVFLMNVNSPEDLELARELA